jgi:hypothetical protein
MSFYLSGSVGYTFLKNNNIHVLLLADIHDGVEYCKQNSKMIAQWLDETSNKYTILLEEVKGDYKLTDLWPGSKHTQELKKLNHDSNKVIPVDIRPQLIPFSWELAKTTNDLGKTTLASYIKLLKDFFRNTLDSNDIMVQNNIINMKQVQSTNNSNESYISPEYHLQQLKKIFDDYLATYKSIMNSCIEDIIKKNVDCLERINNIISMIMEWYIVVLTYNNSHNTIIHIGLAHSKRVLDLLLKVYRFTTIEEYGINKIADVNSITPSSCILVSQSINNIYR